MGTPYTYSSVFAVPNVTSHLSVYKLCIICFITHICQEVKQGVVDETGCAARWPPQLCPRPLLISKLGHVPQATPT